MTQKLDLTQPLVFHRTTYRGETIHPAKLVAIRDDNKIIVVTDYRPTPYICDAFGSLHRMNGHRVGVIRNRKDEAP